MPDITLQTGQRMLGPSFGINLIKIRHVLLRRLALQRPDKVNSLSASKSCGLEPKRKLQPSLHVQIQRLIVSPPFRLHTISDVQ